MFWSNLTGKTIGIWGMGREGIAARQALQNHCPDTSVLEISESNLDDINRCDILIKSPGVSLYRPEIQTALKQGIIITSGTNLFFANKNPRTRVIAVTGTKGKSTTASLLAHTLKYLGQSVELGGNIGRPLLELADTSADFVVAELSSYQCADLIGRPDIGVLVNLYPEHLQWHGSHERYYSDKIHMITQSCQAVLNDTDSQTHQFDISIPTVWFNTPNGIHLEKETFYSGDIPLFSRQKLSLIGTHNAENACAVLTVIQMLGLSPADCAEAFHTFQALPHRLQTIGSKDNLTYVDDSISTTPETAVAALKALSHGQPITLIAGGLDRGQDYTILIDYLAANREKIRLITLPDTGKRLADQAQNHHIETVRTSDMPTAVSIAQHITPVGGTILLSPAAPSYNLYPNFEARGDDFKKWALIPD
ncbi:MAG: UDP-N-acetylmuramoyl-L-alanine--D-glutamate ligase [Alphaproteobacteria bacterium]|nr:UDP-N-acetylmuramoyl-L-alanine--D-glutamate ligase [Alphaproteobacteria bacterium]